MGAIWRFGAFALVCLLGIFALFAIFAQLRFEDENSYRALFTNISGLQEGDFVRIAGVEVGKVATVSLQRDTTLAVEFSTDSSVVLTEGSRAVIRYENVIGDRYLALEQGPGGTATLAPGSTIGVDRTQPALDLDALIGGFRPLFRALNPDQVNTLSTQLIGAFQDQGATISSLLAQTASVTGTLADRDELIGEVIDNLDTVLGSLDEQSRQFDTAVTSLSELIDGLAARRSDISAALAHMDHASGTVADLLAQSRAPLREVVAENDRASGVVLTDHEYFDQLLDTLPDKYRMLGRQGLYGDFFSYYLCDVVLKLNGKGGQPVFVKVASQTTGRCAPK
ncbi:MCE family protein [Mycolicibacterium sp.]|uniref:MCE family protein n=1 Tax=Mycolicibacterium sp. TaxID=2320850 RepID=UPI003D0CB2BB